MRRPLSHEATSGTLRVKRTKKQKMNPPKLKNLLYLPEGFSSQNRRKKKKKRPAPQKSGGSGEKGLKLSFRQKQIRSKKSQLRSNSWVEPRPSHANSLPTHARNPLDTERVHR